MKLSCNRLGTFLEVFQVHKHTCLANFIFCFIFWRGKKNLLLNLGIQCWFYFHYSFSCCAIQASSKNQNLREYAGTCVSSPYKISDSCRQGLKSSQHNLEINLHISALLPYFYTKRNVRKFLSQLSVMYLLEVTSFSTKKS